MRLISPLPSCGLFSSLFVVLLSSPHNPAIPLFASRTSFITLIAHVYVLFVVLYIPPSPIDHHDHQSTIRVTSLYRFEVGT